MWHRCKWGDVGMKERKIIHKLVLEIISQSFLRTISDQSVSQKSLHQSGQSPIQCVKQSVSHHCSSVIHSAKGPHKGWQILQLLFFWSEKKTKGTVTLIIIINESDKNQKKSPLKKEGNKIGSGLGPRDSTSESCSLPATLEQDSNGKKMNKNAKCQRPHSNDWQWAKRFQNWNQYGKALTNAGIFGK